MRASARAVGRAWLAALFLAGCAASAPVSSSAPPATGTAPSPFPPSATAPAATAPVTLTLTPPPSPGLAPTGTPAPTATASAPPPVLILSIDGLRPDALAQARVPNLQALTQRGAYSLQAQTIFPPATLPAHASMLTGLPPAAHGVDWNDYLPERGVITGTLFLSARAAGLRTVLVAGKEKFAHFDAPGALDAYVFATGGDQDVVDQAILQAQAGFGLLVVHLPNPDYFGHLTGWMSETYLFQLTRTDEAVGRLLAALPADTLVIVTADHGGLGLVHGRRLPEDMTIPWLIAGPGVRAGYALTTPVNVMDTAATAACVLGLTLPPEAEGQPVREAFGAGC